MHVDAYSGWLWKLENGRWRVWKFAENVEASSQGKAPFNIIAALRRRSGYEHNTVLRQAHMHMAAPKKHSPPAGYKLKVKLACGGPLTEEDTPFVSFE
jgi:hypothetical protein